MLHCDANAKRKHKKKKRAVKRLLQSPTGQVVRLQLFLDNIIKVLVGVVDRVTYPLLFFCHSPKKGPCSCKIVEYNNNDIIPSPVHRRLVMFTRRHPLFSFFLLPVCHAGRREGDREGGMDGVGG